MSSTNPDWKRLEELFNQALDTDPSARAQFFDESCAGDPAMRAELESLLRSSAAGGDKIEKIIQGTAQDVWSTNNRQVLGMSGRFAHFEVLSEIGSGGMGQVYLAEDPRLNRKIALKTLLSDVAGDEVSLQRFKQEAQSASALNHPNILTIYEVGEYNGTHFIASEFVDGQTIRDKLADAKLPFNEAIDIAIQIAAGLEAAHAAGIIHRDIKPENVIVRNDGLVKVLDFGIARVMRDRPAKPGVPSTSRSQTRPGMLVGTAKYMSPEQARGSNLDARTDIYSLGAVMYEMVSGKAPFEGASDSDLLAEILKTDPHPLHEIQPAVPRELHRIVTKAMDKDRDQRYQNVSHVLADLKAFREDTDFRSKLVSAKRHAGQLQWRAIALIVTALLAIAGGGYALRSLLNDPTSQRPHSLAILPFRNIRQDPATDFLGYSLADAVITKMGYVSSLIVRPSSSIDRYRNQMIDPRKTGAELNVDALLTGSFLKDGDDLRINTQLIDVKHVRILWRDTIDVKYEKLLTVQDRVAQQIIDGLALNLSPSEADHVKFDNPIHKSAYESYLHGVDLYALNDFASAIKALEKSAAMDPGYALTWAHLGRAYTTNASLQFGGREQYRTALERYQRAIELNPALIEPRVYMANLFTDTGRVEEAVPLLRAALTGNKNSADAHWELGYAYRFGGLLQDSERECEYARQLDPEVKINSSALNTYLYLGEYDKFIASLPVQSSAYILFYRGFGKYYKRDYALAAGYFDRAFELNPSLLQANVGKALADATRHENVEGLKLLKQTEVRILETGLSDAEGIYKVSQAYACLGDTASAVRTFRATIAGGFFPYPYFRTDPLIANLRSDPEFQAVMRNAQDRFSAFSKRFSVSPTK